QHGVKRVRQSEQHLEAKRLREQSKIKEYLDLTQDILARKKRADWSMDAFALTTKLLHINPEFYTVWNYRRNICLKGRFPGSSPHAINDILSGELSMTMAALKTHPKVYWIWNHRRWCLENVPDRPGSDSEDISDPLAWRKINWDKELLVVERMLDADPRNFHAWNYRRYILANMAVPRPQTAELSYTTQKIESSFSNFSAWHQRSKILTSLWKDGVLNSGASKEGEFDLVRNAMYTDPSDQSAWMYHRWLVGSGGDKAQLEREIAAILELMQLEPDSKWCLESIVHYKQLLLKNHTSGDRNILINECATLLEGLQVIDPQRHRRYEALG
ncbi:rab-protein geranylgeranyltransferase, partial [Infundibulicybe gibba]